MMSHRFHITRSTRFAATVMVATLGLVSLFGCGSDKGMNPPPPGSGSTTYTGSVTGTGANGKLTITIATSTPKTFGGGTLVTATGTYTPTGGSPIVLAGNYDTESNILGVAGGSWTIGGELTGSRIDGLAVNGAITGYFTVVEGGSEVTVIIGTFTSTVGGDNGSFNISIDGAEVHGYAVTDDGGTAAELNGTYYPVNGDISIVNPANPTGPALATGNYNSGTGHASGQFDDGKSNSGDWQGDKQ